MAVRKAWEFWDCGECAHRNETDPDFDIESAMTQNVTYYDVPLEVSVKM
jgi:hypothetical protein